MSPDLRDPLRSLFERVVDLEPGQRRELLSLECRGQPALRTAVERLVAAAENDSDFLDVPLLEASREQLRRRDLAWQGQRLGPYLLKSCLGRGGTSAVFLAERSDGEFSHQVAIKLIRRGMDSPELEQRFRVERQILADLGHPHIASLLDGGTTPEGLPFVVMEYVPGLPITEHCDRHRLNLKERLELFLKVCDAVHYAHQRLVVHRDLKPANILVTPDGEPKLLDFGIAKLLDPTGDSDATLGRPLTPNYASPEHLAGRRVSTASDVFSLGVLLCELLSGQRPFDLAHLPPLEMAEAMTRSGPIRLSERVFTPEGREAAPPRDATPEALARRLRGDLDSIAATALALDPNERYGTPDRLADDVRRHLEGKPIRARAGRRWYRAGKFLRRHAVVATAAALVALLATTLIVSLIAHARALAQGRDAARQQQTRAEAVTEVLARSFALAYPRAVPPSRLTALAVLEQGVEEAGSLADAPVAQATLLHTLGTLYRELGELETADQLLQRASELRRVLHGTTSTERADSLVELARVRRDRGELGVAEHLARAGLSFHRQALGEAHPRIACDLSLLSGIVRRRGREGEAGELAFASAAMWKSVGHSPLGQVEAVENETAVGLDRTLH